ncbi:hypothetical protein [Streptosporangium sp. NPDC087985]|uniref:hypothetical protein n=1 Tax=Streptosporangium sp. NPDC087985 TaxID=3366196 RepID=UPI00382045E3
MRRSVRNLLGLAAVTATIGIGIPAATTTASASTAGVSSASADNNPDWGPYSSTNSLAKASGYIDVVFNDETSDSVRITGKLWGFDRTYNPSGRCAYVRFRIEYWNHDEGDWSSSLKSYKYCGAGGYKQFDFSRQDVGKAQVQVCQIGQYSRRPTRCGSWYPLAEERLAGFKPS